MSHAADRISRFSLLASLGIHFALLLVAGYMLGQSGLIPGDEPSASSSEEPMVVDIEVLPSHQVTESVATQAQATGSANPAAGAANAEAEPEDKTRTVATTSLAAVVTDKPNALAEPGSTELSETSEKEVGAETGPTGGTEKAVDTTVAPSVPAMTASIVAVPAEDAVAAASPLPHSAAVAAPAPTAVGASDSGGIQYSPLRRRTPASQRVTETGGEPGRVAAMTSPSPSPPPAYVVRKRLTPRPKVEAPATVEEDHPAPATQAMTGAASSVATAAQVSTKAKTTARTRGPAIPSSGRRGTNPAQVKAYGAQLRAYLSQRRPAGNGTEGTVVVGFGVSPSGGLLFAQVRKSSGDGDLDRMALAAVRGAAPFPAPPAGMTAGQLSFTIPIRFR